MYSSDGIGAKKQTRNVQQATNHGIVLLKIMSVWDPPTELHISIHSFIHPFIHSINEKSVSEKRVEKTCVLSSGIKLLTLSSHGEGTQKLLPQTLSP